MRPKVLVTAIGTAASTSIILQLKKTNNYYIIGGDIYKRNQVVSSMDTDEFYTFPSAVKELDAYIDFAVDFCRDHGINYYFATIDEEIANLSRNRKRFEDVGVTLCIPNESLVDICHYKNVFSDWTETNMPEIFIKRFKSFRNIEDESFPLFMKPVEGRASLRCTKVANQEALDKLISDGFQENEYVLQEYTEGTIITVDLIRSSAFKHSEQVQRIEHVRNSNGCGIAVEIIREHQLEKICNQIMENLDLNGVVNAEFFKTDDCYRIIEINPRFSAGTCFSCAAGCDIVLAALDIASGKDFSLEKPEIGLHLAKRYETYRIEKKCFVNNTENL